MINGAFMLSKWYEYIRQTDRQTISSGIIWLQSEHADIGIKTRHDNSQLYVQGSEPTWTHIKPVTTEFAIRRNKTVQVVRKQFPFDLLHLKITGF